MKPRTKAWFRLMWCKVFHGLREADPGILTITRGGFSPSWEREFRCKHCGSVYQRLHVDFCGPGSTLYYRGKKTEEEWVNHIKALKHSYDVDYTKEQVTIIVEGE